MRGATSVQRRRPQRQPATSAMIAQICIAPHGTIMQIGWRLTIPVIIFGGGLCGAILGPGVSKPGHIGAPEYATLVIVTAMVFGFLVKPRSPPFLHSSATFMNHLGRFLGCESVRHLGCFSTTRRQRFLSSRAQIRRQ